MIDILKDILKTRSVQDMANELQISPSTIKRWIYKNNVPTSYRFDLLKMNSSMIDYSIYNAHEKDQFFTLSKTAKHCYDTFIDILKGLKEDETDYTYIEPSAGSGSFMNVLPQTRTIGMDIESMKPNVLEQDYLLWKPEDTTKRYIVFGNPPFGLRGNLALRFINHSFAFADFVGFILPQLFESDGKGSPRKRVEGFNLIHSEKLDTSFIYPNNELVKVNCIFQVWSKHYINEEFIIKKLDNSILTVYSLSDGGTPASTRNKNKLYECDVYIPSTCYGKENMRYYSSFEKLPSRRGYGIIFHKNKNVNIEKFKEIDWSCVAFLSTNSAYNIRSSSIISKFESDI